MKITKILSASVLAGAVLFSGTACSVLDGGKKAEGSPSASASQAPTATESSSPEGQPTETSEAPSEETSDAAVEGVLETVNGYYAFSTDSSSLAKTQAAASALNGKETVTDEELATLVDGFPEGFKYFDTSSPQLIKNAYIQLLAGATAGQSMSGTKIVVPAEAVTYDGGDTATVNPTVIIITQNGEIVPSESDPYATELINLVKKDGKWVMVGEAPKSQ